MNKIKNKIKWIKWTTLCCIFPSRPVLNVLNVSSTSKFVDWDLWSKNVYSWNRRVFFVSAGFASPLFQDLPKPIPPVAKPAVPKGQTLKLEDIFEPPGRYVRPPKIVIILRGLPGAGKSLIAKKIKAKETELGSDAPRVLCLDDYFECDGEVSSYKTAVVNDPLRPVPQSCQ